MNYNKVQFHASYGKYSQIPKCDRIEIAFAGRSNVGKSTLINKIFNRKSLARARMAQQVLSACEQDGELFMIPLLAHHRQMAVNRRRLEQEHLSDLLDARTHPVWYPLELQQALEAL